MGRVYLDPLPVLEAVRRFFLPMQGRQIWGNPAELPPVKVRQAVCRAVFLQSLPLLLQETPPLRIPPPGIPPPGIHLLETPLPGIPLPGTPLLGTPLEGIHLGGIHLEEIHPEGIQEGTQEGTQERILRDRLRLVAGQVYLGHLPVLSGVLRRLLRL